MYCINKGTVGDVLISFIEKLRMPGWVCVRNMLEINEPQIMRCLGWNEPFRSAFDGLTQKADSTLLRMASQLNNFDEKNGD